MEQEHDLTTKSNAKLQDKDSAVKELVNSAIQKLGEEHEKEKQDLQTFMEQQIVTKYEQEYMVKIEALQQRTIAELEQKSQAVEALSKKVKDLEDALASSQNYHEDSLQAHKLSAAALALAEKMESNQGAGVELGALKVRCVSLHDYRGSCHLGLQHLHYSLSGCRWKRQCHCCCLIIDTGFDCERSSDFARVASAVRQRSE
jgi:hypothetical protein